MMAVVTMAEISERGNFNKAVARGLLNGFGNTQASCERSLEEKQ